MTRANVFALAGLAIVLLAGSGLAMAQADLHAPSQAFSGLLELIRNNASQWNSKLQAYAQFLFWSLVVIDLVLIFGQLVMRNADTGELLGELMKFVLTIGFFAAVLIYSVTWSEAIINSFRQAGATAAGVGLQLTPGDMFSLGVELAYLVGTVETMNPGVALSVSLAGLVILLCYTFIAAFMAVTLVESYIATYASVFLLGLGGSKFTRDRAISVLWYAVSVGVKLFILTLIVGLIMESARQWQAAYQHDNASMWTMVGLALVCALLSKTIPDMIQSLINGVSSGGGGQIGGMAAAATAGAAAGAAVMHSFMSGGGLTGAGKGVADLLKSSGVGPSGSGGSGASSMNMMGGAPGGGGSGSASPRSGGSRVGGSSMNYAPPPSPQPSASGSSSGSGSSTNTTSSSSGQSSGGSSGGSGSAASSASTAPAASTAATMAHAAAEMGMKTFGTAASIAVPGMEGSESLSVGPPPSPPEVPDLGNTSGSIDTPENVIRPVADAPAGIDPVAESMQTTTKPIETMADLQNALNNKGKLS